MGDAQMCQPEWTLLSEYDRDAVALLHSGKSFGLRNWLPKSSKTKEPPNLHQILDVTIQKSFQDCTDIIKVRQYRKTEQKFLDDLGAKKFDAFLVLPKTMKMLQRTAHTSDGFD